METYAVLDRDGRIQAWLDAGRAVAVWRSQEIGTARPDLLRPADHGTLEPPHWAYRGGLFGIIPAPQTDVSPPTIAPLLTAIFYAPVCIVQSWRDTPQGRRAARRTLEHTPDEEWAAPGGRFRATHTLEEYTMHSATLRPDSEGGTVLRYRDEGETPPVALAVEFRVGILRWTAFLGPSED